MKVRRIAESAIAGAFWGAFGGSALTGLGYTLLDNSALRDGQFVFVFIWSVPSGVLLGGFGGAVLVLRKESKSKAGWVAVTGAGVIAALTIAFGWASASTRGPGLHEFLNTMAAPEFIITLALAALLAAAGGHLIRGGADPL